MERERIIFFRNFFFAAFIIGLIFGLFYFGATVLFWNTGTSWATHFFKSTRKNLEDWLYCSSFSCASRSYFSFSCRLWLCIGWRARDNQSSHERFWFCEVFVDDRIVWTAR